MSTRIATACLVLAALAGCGGTSPESELRATARQATEALLSDKPESACKYAVDHEKCIGGIATLKALHMDVAATVGYPDDWRDRLTKAKITINGDKATISDFSGDGKPGRYVLRDGRWLADNNG